MKLAEINKRETNILAKFCMSLVAKNSNSAEIKCKCPLHKTDGKFTGYHIFCPEIYL